MSSKCETQTLVKKLSGYILNIFNPSNENVCGILYYVFKTYILKIENYKII